MKKLIALVTSLLLLSSTALADQPAFVKLGNRDGRLNVRSAPEGDIITQLYDGEDVVIIDAVDGWALIRHIQSDSPMGWVSLDYLHTFGAPTKDGRVCNETISRQ